MNSKRVVGIFLSLFGLILIVSQFTITGNVISDNTRNLKGIIGIVFILIGVVLLAQTNSLVGKIETEDERMENIVKFKPCKRVDLARVKQEIERVKTIAHDPRSPEKKTYSLHQVPVAGEVYLVADAKVLNREAHQSRRGNIRYLLDRKTNEYRGLAMEEKDGDYVQVA